jgi:ParB-like chromosome segregation protein Spo0J
VNDTEITAALERGNALLTRLVALTEGVDSHLDAIRGVEERSEGRLEAITRPQAAVDRALAAAKKLAEVYNSDPCEGSCVHSDCPLIREFNAAMAEIS